MIARIRKRRAWLAIGSLWLLATAVRAGPEPAADERALFYRARQQARDGQVAEALASLEALDRQAPNGAYADDALAERARLTEESLGQPERALALWRELGRRFPDSRLARRARSRIAYLQRHLDQGARVLARYQDILRRANTRPASDSARELEALLAAHPGFSLRTEGQLFLAGLLERDGQRQGARRLLGRVIEEAPGQRPAALALSQLGQLELDVGRLDAAREAFAALARMPGPDWARAGQAGLQRVASLRWRSWQLFGSLALWALALAGAVLGVVIGLRRRRLSARGLLRPPVEALVYLAVMGLLLALVGGRARQTMQALWWMTGLLTPLLLASGYSLRGLRLGRLGLLAWIGGAVLASAAGAWAAICLAGMVGQVQHTIEFGTGS